MSSTSRRDNEHRIEKSEKTGFRPDFGQGIGLRSASDFLSTRSWADRNGFPPWMLAMVWVVAAFLLFQLVGSAMALLYLMARSDDPAEMLDTVMFMEHLDVILIGNSVSQILFLGMATWWIAGLSTTGSRAAFLRFRISSSALNVAIAAVVLIIVMQPLIWFLSWVNAQIPMWEGYLAMEQSQLEMIEHFLTSDQFILLTLFHIGVVPSVCEELLFRGYVQRLLERSWGVFAAILLGGILFALFHIRLTQVIPLACIGMLLGWLVWRSGSIIPAMAGHLTNNGGAVLVAYLFSDYVSEQMMQTELPPFWLLLLSAGLTIMLIRYIYHNTKPE